MLLLVGGNHPSVEPMNGAKLLEGTLEVPVGAACLQRRLHVQSGHVCRLVLIGVMSCSFTALLMVSNKDYSLDVSV